MSVNKWCFHNFHEDVRNFNYMKSIPFCTFSDVSTENDYKLIASILDYIHYDQNKFISIGPTVSSFGISLNPDNVKDINFLLNSCQFSFVLSSDIKDTNFLIKSILSGIIPICNIKHPFIKQMGLSSYAVDVSKQNILDKLTEIMYYPHIYHNRTYRLSWQYYNKIQKWKNNR